ncbi:LysR family transcriptional regulator [Virgibacillus sp. C22-A2]|uniref:LysR family transcriptional regulator n=1 Tax=Virgibacillus tibetensis TaxID=3042313 RepID=A0ABU6KC55_9BACI|nr:LysR family transcriptional regulator [Virgibacillus sp. C22-A2]
MDQHLVVFVTVADYKNFSRAAEALHMSQPAVSQYIAALEREFEVKLLERNNKSVQVNKAGQIVYQYAKEILRNYERMQILVSDLKNDPSGELKIGASYTIGEYFLPGLLGVLRKRYLKIVPDVTIGNTTEIAQKLLNHQIDIGLVEGDFNHRSILTQHFATDDMYIIAGEGQSLIKQSIVLPKELEKQTWIIREEGSGTRKMVEDFFQKHSIQPLRVLTFGSTQIIKEAVEAGLGISLLSDLTIKKELKLNTISKLLVKDTPVQRKFSIIKNNQEFHTKAMQVFEQVVNTAIARND